MRIRKRSVTCVISFLWSKYAGALRILRGVLLVLGSTIQLAHASLMPGWTPPLTIQGIIVEDGDAIVLIGGGVPAGYLRDDCNSSPLNVIDLNTAPGRSKLAVAVAAYTTGQPVQLALQACSSGRPMITHILMGSGV